jgi:hypothetical protein
MDGGAGPLTPEKTARIESRLRALRKEMLELAAMLGAPMPTAESPVARIKPLRPRLVTDSRPLASRPEPPKLERRIAERRQGDLFPVE